MPVINNISVATLKQMDVAELMILFGETLWLIPLLIL